MQNAHYQLKPFLKWMLFIYAFILGIETGAASFVTVVVFPLWASSPGAATGWLPSLPCYLEEGDFFMFASTGTMLAALLTFIAGLRAPVHLRKWILIASVGFIIIFIWSMIYFVPVQDTTLKGAAGAQLDPEVLGSKLRMFVNLNYIRVGSLYFIFGIMLYVISRMCMTGRIDAAD